MKKIERKDFLKMAGGAVAGGLVGATVSGAPFNGLQWLVEWTQDQYRPGGGEEKFRQGICGACGTDISVRMIGDRAVKVETANAGCPVCQTLIQFLYHPERVQRPLKRVGGKGSGRFAPVEWSEAIRDISDKIKNIRAQNKPHAVAAVNGSHNLVTNAMMERLLAAIGSGHVYEEPCFCTLSSQAARLTQNNEGALDYDFENADYVLSFGARLFEGWGNQARMHKVLNRWKAAGTKFVQVDTLGTRTASLAAKWVPVKPGTEAILALGIAYKLIMNHGRAGNLPELGRWPGINDFSPDKVSALTGVPVEQIDELAREFAGARRGVAVAGRGGEMVSSSVAEIIAVQCLNKLTGRMGVPGGVLVKMKSNRLGAVRQDAVARAGMTNTRKAKGLDDFIKNGEKPELLFINDANPVHQSVFGKDLANKLKEIPMVVAFMTMKNDTARYADYILPTFTILESKTGRGDAVIPKRFDSKHGADIIIEIAKRVEGVANSFTWNGFADVANLVGLENRPLGNFTLNVDVIRTYLDTLKKTLEGAAAEYPLALIPFEIPLVGNGSGLALPYVLKSIGKEEYAFERMVAQINPETADAQGVCEGSSIKIASRRGKTGRVRVHITKTVAPGVVAVPMGFGHTAYTEYAEDKGVNPLAIMTDSIDPESGTADWWYTRVKIS
jgi:anaerobic selenocysteine-containing dehydrogenase